MLHTTGRSQLCTHNEQLVWLHPEQIQGTGTDPLSDLRALCATLYHLATSVPPANALACASAQM
jgi:hypothetical protein